MSNIKFFLCFLFAGLSLSAFFAIEATPVVSSTELLDHIYAVHATRSLPDSDYLRAGWGETSAIRQKAFIPQVRKTLHFALGELVRPVHGFMNWEDCPYAVVTPLRSLLPQLINLNCYDTFIFGDLKLGPETYVVVPMKVAKNIKSQATIVTYSPNCKTLRQAVDELILSKGGYHIEMNDEDIEDELHEAFLEGENINTPEFFAPLKEGRPWLAVGLRFDELEGEHYRLSQMEGNFVVVATHLFSKKKKEAFKNLTTAQVEKMIHQTHENFEQWSQSLVGFSWCSESLQAYQQLATEIQKWSVFLQEELRLRKIYGKTFILAPDDFLVKCLALLDQEEALQKFVEENQQTLSKYPKEELHSLCK